MRHLGQRQSFEVSEHTLFPMASDFIHLAFVLFPETPYVLPTLCCLVIKFTLKLSRKQQVWIKNRFYDKARLGWMPLAWWYSRNQSKITSFSILMRVEVCVFRNTFLIICCDMFCNWLPSGIWRWCILLSCTRSLFISDSTDVYFL